MNTEIRLYKNQKRKSEATWTIRGRTLEGKKGIEIETKNINAWRRRLEGSLEQQSKRSWCRKNLYPPSLPRRETLFLCRIESSLLRECRMRSRMEWRWDISSFYVRCSHIAGWADKKNVTSYIIRQLCDMH